MRYSDLKAQTESLTTGRHLIYNLAPDAVFIDNAGRRHPHLPAHPVYRLVVRWNRRETKPRNSDIFTDFQLKVTAKPELRLSLLEACEQICNGADPVQVFESRGFPQQFREGGDAEWALPMTMYQTAGLPTLLFLCVVQVLILVTDYNDRAVNAPQIFRHAFNRLAAGDSVFDITKKLAPQTPIEKRYYDLSKRK
jgi:hypothetical protein